MNSINFWYKTQQQIFFFLCLVLCDILATFVVNQHIQCLPANDRGWEDCITLLIQAPTVPEDATTDTGKVPSSTGAMLKKKVSVTSRCLFWHHRISKALRRKNTTDAMFYVRLLMEKYRKGRKKWHCVFVNLEKAYDMVPKEELWYCKRKSEAAEKYVRVVQDMYEDR